MSDTERLNLIEHYKWKIGYTHAFYVKGDNGIFVVMASTLREAIDDALEAQIDWSLGR
jgi:hypothetical protein